MKKEKHNNTQISEAEKKKPAKEEKKSSPNHIQKEDVDHGDIDYDPGDPHGLKTNGRNKQEK